MLFINHLNKNEWWEFNKEKMIAYNYMGGHNSVDKEILKQVEICEYENWHKLYIAKNYCPLEEDKWENNVWISPDGKYYNGDAHEVKAAYLCDIIYGLEDLEYGGDELESRGWIRATTSLMWEIRFDEWIGKSITQKQFDSLWDWCECHMRKFPKGIIIK